MGAPKWIFQLKSKNIEMKERKSREFLQMAKFFRIGDWEVEKQEV